MTRQEIIAHWRKGARESLKLAELAHREGSHALALFHCHLAVEKALKAEYMTMHDKDPPPTHNLVLLADELGRAWSSQDKEILNDLTDYAVAARYDDPQWAQSRATEQNSAHWLSVTKNFLNAFP